MRTEVRNRTVFEVQPVSVSKKNQGPGGWKWWVLMLELHRRIETESQFHVRRLPHPPRWSITMLNRLTDSFPASHAVATRPVCHCLRVEEHEIRDVIEDGELHTVRQVTASCGAGGGCTACHRHIKRFLAEAARERAAQEQSAMEPVFGFA